MRSLPVISVPTFIDPVCGMTVKPETAAGKCEYNGSTYYFCAVGCLNKFQNDPGHFLMPAEKRNLPADVEYTCPMHPEVVQIGPGACPKCGMALEPSVFSLDAKEDTSEFDSMKRRFWIGVALTLPLLVLTMGEMLPGDPVMRFIPAGIFGWIQFALATPVVLWGGLPLF